MKKKFLEAGKIVNTHGIRGEVKIQPWCDSPEFLTSFRFLYIDGEPVKIKSSKIQKSNIIVSFEGYNTIDDAVKLKNKTIFIDREDVTLDSEQVFIQDLFGLTVIDDSGNTIGKLSDVLTLPANDVYVVKLNDDQELLIPAVNDFILEKNIDEGFIKVHLIEGL